MAKSHVAPLPPGNRLLARLPPREYRRLLPLLRQFPLKFKHVLHEARSPIDYVYFPSRGVVSAVTLMEDGTVIEVATVGNEGMVGLTAFLGDGDSPNRQVVQVPGDSLRMSADDFRTETSRDMPTTPTADSLQHSLSQTNLPGRSLQRTASCTAAVLPLGADDPRPSGGRRVPTHPRVPVPYAWRAPHERYRRSQTPARRRANPKPARPNHCAGSARARGHCLRVLQECAKRVRPFARTCSAICSTSIGSLTVHRSPSTEMSQVCRRLIVFGLPSRRTLGK